MREILKFIVQMKKSGRRTYLNEDEESLVIGSANIEGYHVLQSFVGVTPAWDNPFKYSRATIYG